ncbi:hypothetical protein D3C78_761060 [compost metagenome]
MLGARQRWHEPWIFHQFPGGQINAPGFRQARLIAVLVPQLLEECTFGRHVGGHFQGAVGQGITGFRIIPGTGPGQFVVGVVTDQPRIVTMIAGGNGHGTFGGHGETRVEGVGHAAPPVGTGADAGVVADDRQRQGIWHAIGVAQYRGAPVADGVEAPGLQAIKGVTGPALLVEQRFARFDRCWLCRCCYRRFSLGGFGDAGLGGCRSDGLLRSLGRCRFNRIRLGRCGDARFGFAAQRARITIQTLQIGTVEVVPAPGIVAAPLIGTIAAAVVAFAVVAGQRLVSLGQGLEHPLATGHIGLIDIRGQGIDPKGVERMAFRRHQIPSTVALFGAEKAAGLERRAFGQSAKFVQRRLLTLSEPGFQLLLFLGGGAFHLLVAADFFRPFGPGRLAIRIHQPAIHDLADRLAVLHTKALQQDALRGFGLVHRQRHGHHLAAIQLTGAAGQQHTLALNGHRHRRAGLHALAQG